jgi:hypothetical protein
MGEVIQFVSKSERERMRLIREARERYESVFPSADSEPRHRASIGRAAGVANFPGGDDVQS